MRELIAEPHDMKDIIIFGVIDVAPFRSVDKA